MTQIQRASVEHGIIGSGLFHKPHKNKIKRKEAAGPSGCFFNLKKWSH